jgi:uncharacterized protein YcfL
MKRLFYVFAIMIAMVSCSKPVSTEQVSTDTIIVDSIQLNAGEIPTDTVDSVL